MDIRIELIIVSKLLIAFLLGGLVGYERERHGRSAGIRTYAAVCIGATLFTSIAGHLQDATSSSRIIANIVVGIGFLGAGIVYHNADNASGLTTAATVWCTAGVGVAVGLNMFVIATVAAGALYLLLSLHHLPWYIRWKKKLKDPNPPPE